MQDVPLAEALATLVEQTSYLAWLGDPLQTMAAHMRRISGLARVTYRDAEQLLPLVADLATAGVTEEATPISLAPASPGDGYARSPMLDAIRLEQLVAEGVLTRRR